MVLRQADVDCCWLGCAVRSVCERDREQKLGHRFGKDIQRAVFDQRFVGVIIGGIVFAERTSSPCIEKDTHQIPVQELNGKRKSNCKRGDTVADGDRPV